MLSIHSCTLLLWKNEHKHTDTDGPNISDLSNSCLTASILDEQVWQATTAPPQPPLSYHLPSDVRLVLVVHTYGYPK
jgi:hypothetical protein